MLHIHHGNRPEALLDALAGRLAAAPAGPYEHDLLLVPHQALARWLMEGLAQRLGICAGLDVRFPAEFVWQLVHAAVPDWPRADAWQPRALSLAVYAEMEAAVAGTADGLQPLAEAAAPLDAAARLALARELAAALDQYAVLRPDWVRQWEAGAAPHWQARLWWRLRARLGGRHWVAAQDALARRLRDPAPLPGLPPRVFCFGLAPLSPALLQLLHAVAGRGEWHWYHPSPCREYWGLIESRRQAARRALRGGEPGDAGNGLLASLGREPRDFYDALLEAADTEEGHYTVPPGSGLLAAVQRAVLELKEPAELGLPCALAADDASLCVLACHGPVRELQAVRDQLLDAFAVHAALNPADVLLLAPDPGRYAPYLEAVFAHGEPPLPVSAPARPLAASGAARAFMQLLALPEGRFEVNALLDLFDTPAVSARLGLDAAPPGLLRRWLHAAGIRWGLDGAQRAALHLPAEPALTWRWGLDRLLLGLAQDGTGPDAGLLPVPVALSEAEWLGVLADRLEQLAALEQWLRQPHGAAEWSARLVQELEAWLAPAAEPFEAAAQAALHAACHELAEQARLAGLATPLPRALVADWLAEALAAPGPAPRTAGMRFGSLAQYRGMPAEVVAVLGLADGALPRARRAPAFDLVAHGERRRGDRAARDEDRALFLEALLSARKRLILSYPAFAPQDAAPLPPSALVDELLAHIAAAFDAPADFAPPQDVRQVSALRQWLVRAQPLQAFSPRLFDGSDARRFSYDAAACAAACALQAAALTAPGAPFCAAPLPSSEAAAVLTLTDWEASLTRPARALVRRLRLDVEPGEAALNEAERFPARDTLADWNLRRRCLEAHRSGEGAAALYARFAAEGALPLGAGARPWFEAHWREAAAQLRNFPAGFLPPQELDLELDGWRLLGRLDGLNHEGQWLTDASKQAGAPLLRLWLRHLLLCHVRPAGVILASHLRAQDGPVQLRAVADPVPHLRLLLECHAAARRGPLPLLPRSSHAYAQALREGKGEDEALRRARAAWKGDEHQRGDAQDSATAFVWRGRDPLADPAFPELARAVFRPLLEHLA